MNSPAELQLAIDSKVAIASLAQRYRTSGRFNFYYVGSKLKRDTILRQLMPLAPFGDVADIGSGRGQTSLYLYQLQLIHSIWGGDADAKKVEASKRVAKTFEGSSDKGSSIEFVTFDLGVGPIKLPAPVDSIFLIDVLHYLPKLRQKALIQELVLYLKPGGRIFLRELDHSQKRNSKRTVWAERLAGFLGINRGRTLDFVELSTYRLWLQELGLDCQEEQAKEQDTFNNFLLVGSVS